MLSIVADIAVNLLIAAGLSASAGRSGASSVLSEPYEGWSERFLPREDSAPEFRVESSSLHGNGALALEPGLRLGSWQLAAPVTLSWLDWRTEALRFDWVVPAYTDAVRYRFRDPSLGLSLGRWIGPLLRPWIGLGAFRWERLHSTYGGEVDFLGSVRLTALDTEVLDRGWGAHLELGLAARPPGHAAALAATQGLRASARLTRFSDGYTAAGLALTWAFGVDYAPPSGGEDA